MVTFKFITYYLKMCNLIPKIDKFCKHDVLSTTIFIECFTVTSEEKLKFSSYNLIMALIKVRIIHLKWVRFLGDKTIM